MRLSAILLACSALGALLAAAPAMAQKPSAARGAKVVEQWCRDCHLKPADRPDPDMAPPYKEIVTWDGRDRAWFERFLKEDHFPMTTYRLFPEEKADVVEWLMSLKPK